MKKESRNLDFIIKDLKQKRKKKMFEKIREMEEELTDPYLDPEDRFWIELELPELKRIWKYPN